MQGRDAVALLQTGRRALERADWESARSAFAAALDPAVADVGGTEAEARDGLAQVLWFLGRVPEAVALREQAFAGHVRAGRCADAARCAVWVAHQHLLGGRSSAARGWLARAERVLAGVPVCAGHGWVAVERARQATTVAERSRAATGALGVARATGDPDLEVLAISLLGRAEVQAGHPEPGMLLLEEAMAAATADRPWDVHTLGEAYCNLVLGCAMAGEWTRATEWCEHVETYARTRSIAPLFGACRTAHAELLLAGGRWADAEVALQDALARQVPDLPEISAATVASLAELRVQQGRLEDAERLLAGREEHPAALRALALLHLADGRPRQAQTLLERGLRAASDDAVLTGGLLSPLVHARLSAGDVPGAGVAAGELAALAEATGIRLLTARAELAGAAVALAAGRPAEAAEAARCALRDSTALLMPFESAHARLALARAVLPDDPGTAAAEAGAALAVFRGLGAARAADTAAAVLRGCGVPVARRARVGGELSAREEEVLALVARGLTNAGIARALVISEKTAGHHVSHILAKLGARNRAEAAAAYADPRRPTVGTAPR
ncbi:helix-turn-helix transcriptional regulator [Modestobacter muralis]|uniref:Helix-turn-helix transcriptional regulator n=1 Tax=Modestobacter muralis TaxID=1608614 RepID=A0A6P0EQ49_9ACTN|nr:helix-turn-helix transcriptional regulator [Modestobacter muralis]NEK93207.1 helix-turn-helix transcriptional regulator [Modestobacter muralis]NEN49974.1 helix-turn-helix transcriptional regulator [Modestobacter muralis]